jgi:hypothetical protein
MKRAIAKFLRFLGLHKLAARVENSSGGGGGGPQEPL